MTNTIMNINVNVMWHALVAVVSRRVVILMRLSTRSLLGLCLAIVVVGVGVKVWLESRGFAQIEACATEARPLRGR
jgi:hypothetical protein